MRKITCVECCFLAWGCVVGPNYKRPVIHPPDKFYPEANPKRSSLADLALVGILQRSCFEGS